MPRYPSRRKARPNDASPFSPPSSASDPFDKGLAYAQQRVSQSPQPDLTTLAAPEITPLDALLSMQRPNPEWVIPELLPVGITLLTGRQGVGKSWLAFKMALAIANNTPMLGLMPVSQGRVLYLGLEENRSRTLDRATKLLQGQVAPNTLELADSWHPLAAGGLADIEDWLDAHESARLVVIDSLISVYTKQRSHHRFANNASKERESAIMIPLKVIAEMHHIAILVIHHQRRTETSDFSDDTGLAVTVPGYIDVTGCTMLLKHEQETQKTTLHITGQQVVEKVVTLFGRE
ncbi:MAG: AAA family ATPase [Ktedonobacteraceae bacterium]